MPEYRLLTAVRQSVIAATLLISAVLPTAATALDVSKEEIYGFSTAKIRYLLLNHQVAELRALIAKTPRQSGDDEYRKLLEAATLACNQDFERAAVAFDKTKGLAQANDQILIMAAQSYGNMVQYPKAIECATHAIQKSHDRDAYKLRAGCYMAQNRFVEAARDYQAMAEIDPPAADSYIAKAAKALLDAHKPQEALNMIDKYLTGKGSKNGISITICRTLCLEQLHRPKEALADISRAVDRVNKDPKIGVFERCSYMCTILQERAKCYDQLGQTGKAMADRERVKKLTSDTFEDAVGK
jgi:tetratricopeptide (TPR) repeat protein